MTNLVIDLSNMFYRSMFAISGYSGPQLTFDDQSELDQLMRKVSTDITYIVRQTNPSRVVLTMDSRSWRKDIEIEENEGYKGHRELNKAMNWDNIFSIMNEFSEIAEINGFIISKIDTAEADDLMCLWRDEFLFNKEQHVILVSGDKDIKQLVAHNYTNAKKEVFATIFNPFKQGKSPKKLFHESYFKKWLETPDIGDIFNRGIDVDKEDIIKLINDGIVPEEIDGEEIALHKVFCGDDGDNVPAIYTWIGKTKKGDEISRRITDSKYKKIKESLGFKDYVDLGDHIVAIKEHIEEIADHAVPFQMKERLQRQINLVVLSKHIFPLEIVESFDDECDKKLEAKQLHPQNWNMNTFLEGTKYVRAKGDKNPNAEHSIFKQIDSLNKPLF